MNRWEPIEPGRLPAVLATYLNKPGRQRVAVDGPECARPQELAAAVVETLRGNGRPAVHVRAHTFWRDASLRLEYGRQDPTAYLSWLDAPALRREVLEPFVRNGHYLPSLRDPQTNRSTRAPAVRAEPDSVLVVAGSLLLGLGLPFDITVHLALSPAARARRTPEAERWTLPALDEYDALADPLRHANVIVRMDDPRHPAVSLRTPDSDA